MGRKTQITAEVILENALQMLIRDGYSAINIKTLAAQIGCSTQPIVWHFENMQGFRKAFYEYCIAYARSQFTPWNGSLDDLLTETARVTSPSPAICQISSALFLRTARRIAVIPRWHRSCSWTTPKRSSGCCVKKRD